MRAYDIISKKKHNIELDEQEINFFINGYVSGEIPDYQMSAFLMAIYFNGMSDKEIVFFTKSMINSGEIANLSEIDGVKVDKHSTGGIGDKTTLIILPIVAACGVHIAKMSGRALGFTGGTIDKLEAIPGMRLNFSKDNFLSLVKKIGFSIASQTENFVPADKKIYSLRDVTATVDSIPLIASSVMSKKIASGADSILLDVKCGTGAFMKSYTDAEKLAKTMVNIGKNLGKNIIALITNMNSPLGKTIGNAIELNEVCEVLQGEGEENLTNLCIELAANMLFLAKKGTLKDCKLMAMSKLNDNSAYENFRLFVRSQGGNLSYLDDISSYYKNFDSYKIFAEKEGHFCFKNAEKCGIASMILGAGRQTKDDVIDYNAGIKLHKKNGDYVKNNDLIAEFYCNSIEKCKNAQKIFLESFDIKKVPNNKEPLIFDVIS